MDALIKRKLSGCRTILDLGCGYCSSLVAYGILPSNDLTVGVEVFEPYLLDSKRRGAHKQYIMADVRRIDFMLKSFDAVVAIGLLEHLTKDEGYELLSRMEKWAKMKVVVSTPNGFVPQYALDNNPFQERKCGWRAKELREFGFEVFGCNTGQALRPFRVLLSYSPLLVRVVIYPIFMAVTQKITYYYPRLAFHLLAIKRIDHGDLK